MSEIEQPDMENMSVEDWKEYLKNYNNRCLVINASDGVHAVHYTDHDGRVTFFADGNKGYDEEGTQAVLESVAGNSRGLKVQTVEETY